MAYKVVDEMNFSIIHPRMVYYSNDSVMPRDILQRMNWGNVDSPIFFPENSGEKYYARRIRRCGKDAADDRNRTIKIIQHYTELITHPPVGLNVIWPTDMIELTADKLDSTTIMVANNHQVFESDGDTRISPNALLFGCTNGTLTENVGQTILSYMEMFRAKNGPKQCNYRNPIVRRLAYSVVYAIYNINRYGYLYYDMDFNRFYVNRQGFVLLDFSNMIYTNTELMSINSGATFIEEQENYPLTYAEPALFQKKLSMPDYNSQNYSMAAMIFRLLFGIDPYNGVLYDYMDDSTRMTLYNKCQQYLNDPVFIFSEEDKRNPIGNSSLAELQEELWNQCPDEIKRMFTRTLEKDNATRSGAFLKNPTPADWLNIFTYLKWI